MKKLILLCSIVAGLFTTSCDQSNDLMFDTHQQYIWFSMPFVQTIYGQDTEVRQDSIHYSFSLDGPEIDHHVFKLPVNVAGIARDYDRPFTVEVIREKTDADDETWDIAAVQHPIIHKNTVFDTLYIRVERTKELQSSYKHIALRLKPNDNFQLSDSVYAEAMLSYTDILTAPNWWSSWGNIFGTFCPETYLKWRELYYKGADPTANLYDPSQTYYYHCDNMPPTPQLSWYPILKMYLGLLQNYFNENEIYPYGDTTKPRIQIKF